MYQGTYHYVQRLVGEGGPEPYVEHWVDVPFEDGSVWRSRRFVTAANHIDALRAQELANGVELEQYRVVKRTLQEQVIVPRWRYIEMLKGVGADGVEVWERIAFGDNGADWRCQALQTARDEVASRLKLLSGDAKFRIIGPDGDVEGTFTKDAFFYAVSDDDDDDDDDTPQFDSTS
jgi:hypothetical protein